MAVMGLQLVAHIGHKFSCCGRRGWCLLMVITICSVVKRPTHKGVVCNTVCEAKAFLFTEVALLPLLLFVIVIRLLSSFSPLALFIFHYLFIFSIAILYIFHLDFVPLVAHSICLRIDYCFIFSITFFSLFVFSHHSHRAH